MNLSKSRKIQDHHSRVYRSLLGAGALGKIVAGEIVQVLVTRQIAIDANKPLIGDGMKDPASLDDNDPAIKAANTLFFEYIKQSDILAKGNLESEVRNTISKTMFYVDAGFHNPKYLSEIHSLLMESVGEVEKKDGTTERAKTRQLMFFALMRVRQLLKETEGKNEVLQ